MRSLLRIVLVLIQVFVALKPAFANIVVSLECPFGWKIHGQGRYTKISYNANMPKSVSYFDSYLAICILCEFDCYFGSRMKYDWIEICTYKSQYYLYGPLEYHLFLNGGHLCATEYHITSSYSINEARPISCFNVMSDTLITNTIKKLNLNAQKYRTLLVWKTVIHIVLQIQKFDERPSAFYASR